jgi:hypothetical protein
MIQEVTIQNFKSIKELAIKCSRVNLFIGDPNTGKSNILEALGLFALPYTDDIHTLIRKNDLSNLFFENDVSNNIVVKANSFSYEFYFHHELVHCVFTKDAQNTWRYLFASDQKLNPPVIRIDFNIHPYYFKSLTQFTNRHFNEFLHPPNGDNLFSILQKNKNLRKTVSEIIDEKGFKLTLRHATREIELTRESEGVLTAYPYSIISDTLQRLIFFLAAIESNTEGTTLIFEEPESNVFPYYTKYLAERIAGDSGKQYFISTHNPYFLQSIVEKTQSADLTINLVEIENYQTQVVQLSEKGKQEVLNLNNDVFLNFDHLIDL